MQLFSDSALHATITSIVYKIDVCVLIDPHGPNRMATGERGEEIELCKETAATIAKPPLEGMFLIQ